MICPVLVKIPVNKKVNVWIEAERDIPIKIIVDKKIVPFGSENLSLFDRASGDSLVMGTIRVRGKSYRGRMTITAESIEALGTFLWSSLEEYPHGTLTQKLKKCRKKRAKRKFIDWLERYIHQEHFMRELDPVKCSLYVGKKWSMDGEEGNWDAMAYHSPRGETLILNRTSWNRWQVKFITPEVICQNGTQLVVEEGYAFFPLLNTWVRYEKGELRMLSAAGIMELLRAVEGDMMNQKEKGKKWRLGFYENLPEVAGFPFRAVTVIKPKKRLSTFSPLKKDFSFPPFLKRPLYLFPTSWWIPRIEPIPIFADDELFMAVLMHTNDHIFHPERAAIFPNTGMLQSAFYLCELIDNLPEVSGHAKNR